MTIRAAAAKAATAAIKTTFNTGFNWIKTRKSKQEKKPQVLLQESARERVWEKKRSLVVTVVGAAGVWLSVTTANN